MPVLPDPALPLILACSPRRDGNCDTAAQLFATAFGRNAGFAAPPPVTRLRDFRISPCLACAACACHNPYASKLRACPQTALDDSEPLLRALALAPSLCLIAPIFFYHIPSPLKALLDRTQPFWLHHEAQPSPETPVPERPCRVILIAGRAQGAQLFAGSLLTLRYALASLRLRLTKPLLLRGLDAIGALAASRSASLAVTAYGRQADS